MFYGNFGHFLLFGVVSTILVILGVFWSIYRYFGDFRGILIKKNKFRGYFGCFRGSNIILMILGVFWSSWCFGVF